MATARNFLTEIMQNPGSFSGSPGFQFALDRANQATSRAAAARGMRGSGNVLADLVRQSTGMAQQDYGNEVQRRLAAAGLEQEGDLQGKRLALDDKLGTGQLDLGRGKLALEDRLGTGRLALDERLGTGQLDLGAGRLSLDTVRAGNEYDLGSRGIEAGRERSWWDYSLGADRNEIDRADKGNRYNVDMYNAQTQRGRARSDDFLGRDQARRAWQPSGPARSRFDDMRPAWAR
jgi:hypothetical protein